MRHRKTRDIVIELTSLLDVVMILIFGVMITNAQLVEASKAELLQVQEENIEMKEELAELEGMSEELANALAKLDEGEIEDLLNRIQSAESQLEAYEYMEDVVVVFNVGLENIYSERRLTYGKALEDNGGKTLIAKGRNEEDWEYAVNSLKIDLNEFLEKEISGTEDKYIYIVFNVNESKVYSNDYDDIVSALETVEAKYDNGQVSVRIKSLNGESE